MTDNPQYTREQNRRVDLPWYKRFEVPVNTPIATYATYELTLPRGESEYIWLEFPRGCAGLVGVQVWRNTWQIFPRPGDEWFVSDNSTVKFRFREVFPDVPNTVQIRAYNLDQVYTHTLWIAFEMVALRTGVSSALASFLELLDRQGI